MYTCIYIYIIVCVCMCACGVNILIKSIYSIVNMYLYMYSCSIILFGLIHYVSSYDCYIQFQLNWFSFSFSLSFIYFHTRFCFLFSFPNFTPSFFCSLVLQLWYTQMLCILLMHIYGFSLLCRLYAYLT